MNLIQILEDQTGFKLFLKKNKGLAMHRGLCSLPGLAKVTRLTQPVQPESGRAWSMARAGTARPCGSHVARLIAVTPAAALQKLTVDKDRQAWRTGAVRRPEHGSLQMAVLVLVEQRHATAGGGSGSFTEVGGGSGTCGRRRGWDEKAWHPRRGRNRGVRYGGSLQERQRW
jgi:hypothetical protein